MLSKEDLESLSDDGLYGLQEALEPALDELAMTNSSPWGLQNLWDLLEAEILRRKAAARSTVLPPFYRWEQGEVIHYDAELTCPGSDWVRVKGQDHRGAAEIGKKIYDEMPKTPIAAIQVEIAAEAQLLEHQMDTFARRKNRIRTLEAKIREEARNAQK